MRRSRRRIWRTRRSLSRPKAQTPRATSRAPFDARGYFFESLTLRERRPRSDPDRRARRRRLSNWVRCFVRSTHTPCRSRAPRSRKPPGSKASRAVKMSRASRWRRRRRRSGPRTRETRAACTPLRSFRRRCVAVGAARPEPISRTSTIDRSPTRLPPRLRLRRSRRFAKVGSRAENRAARARWRPRPPTPSRRRRPLRTAGLRPARPSRPEATGKSEMWRCVTRALVFCRR